MPAELNTQFAAEVQERVPQGEQGTQPTGLLLASRHLKRERRECLVQRLNGAAVSTSRLYACRIEFCRWGMLMCRHLCAGKQVIVLCEAGGSLQNKSGTKVREGRGGGGGNSFFL